MSQKDSREDWITGPNSQNWVDIDEAALNKLAHALAQNVRSYRPLSDGGVEVALIPGVRLEITQSATTQTYTYR